MDVGVKNEGTGKVKTETKTNIKGERKSEMTNDDGDEDEKKGFGHARGIVGDASGVVVDESDESEERKVEIKDE